MSKTVKKLFSKKEESVGGLKSSKKLPLIFCDEEELIQAIGDSDFSESELMNLYDIYAKVSKNMAPVDKKQFYLLIERIGIIKEILNYSDSYTSAAPGEKPITIHWAQDVVIKETVKGLFFLFDDNKDGRIDLKEFICGCSIIIKGDIEKTAKAVFKCYDLNGDGELTRQEMTHWIRNAMKSAKKIKKASQSQLKDELGKIQAAELSRKVDVLAEEKWIKEICDEIFSEADVDKNGVLTESEFVSFARKHPEIIRTCPWSHIDQ